MSSGSSVFQVKDIVGHRQTSGKDYYLVHWLGYSTKDNTWEPVENLLNCSNLIEKYQQQDMAEDRRKSLRVRPTPTRDIMLSSDEETLPSAPMRRKSLRSKKSASPARTTMSKRVSSSASPSKQFVRKYYLRSAEFSSDEDSGFVNSQTTRMSLSESRFRKQLADIKEGKFPSPQQSTSTPQKGGQSRSPKSKVQKSPPKQPDPTSTKVQAKTKLLFDNSPSKVSTSIGKPSMVTRHQRRKLEEEITVAEADETDPENPPPTLVRDITDAPAKEKPSSDLSEAEQCFPVTWKEFALAAFVTGVAAVGYVCYTTDYCSYC